MKQAILFAITILLFISIVLCFTAISAQAGIQEKKNVVSIYDSIKVSQGETLEDLAEEYNTSGCYSNMEYIDEIKRINNMYSDTIHAGCYLTVISYK